MVHTTVRDVDRDIDAMDIGRNDGDADGDDGTVDASVVSSVNGSRSRLLDSSQGLGQGLGQGQEQGLGHAPWLVSRVEDDYPKMIRADRFFHARVLEAEVQPPLPLGQELGQGLARGQGLGRTIACIGPQASCTISYQLTAKVGHNNPADLPRIVLLFYPALSTPDHTTPNTYHYPNLSQTYS